VGDNLRVGFNVRKKQVLELLARRPMTALDVASRLGIKESTARHHLVRYWRYRLLDRVGGEMNPGRGQKPFIYRTSAFGSKKIKMLKIKDLKIK
jgi:predicted ArsR family transcriptional regulator